MTLAIHNHHQVSNMSSIPVKIRANDALLSLSEKKTNMRLSETYCMRTLWYEARHVVRQTCILLMSAVTVD